jgi:hypothetical protein
MAATGGPSVGSESFWWAGVVRPTAGRWGGTLVAGDGWAVRLTDAGNRLETEEAEIGPPANQALGHGARRPGRVRRRGAPVAPPGQPFGADSSGWTNEARRRARGCRGLRRSAHHNVTDPEDLTSWSTRPSRPSWPGPCSPKPVCMTRPTGVAGCWAGATVTRPRACPCLPFDSGVATLRRRQSAWSEGVFGVWACLKMVRNPGLSAGLGDIPGFGGAAGLVSLGAGRCGGVVAGGVEQVLADAA